LLKKLKQTAVPIKVFPQKNFTKEDMSHWEVGSKKAVLEVLKVFSRNYPVKLAKMRKRIEDLRRILNDYTPGASRN
jgi:hypothetical protein